MLGNVGKKSYKRIEQKMNYLSMTFSPKLFIYMRLVSSLILFIFLLFLSPFGYIVAPVSTFVYYFFIEYAILDIQLDKRKNELEGDSLEFFRVFMLVLDSGNSIKKCIDITTKQVDNSISLEFKRVLKDVRVGKSLDESLNLLINRIPSILVRNIIVTIIAGNKKGNNVSLSIKEQLEYIEQRNKKAIINYHRIMPIKMAIASFIFMFLVIMLLIIVCI